MVKLFTVTSPNYSELYNIFVDTLQPESNNIEIYVANFDIGTNNNPNDIWHNAMRFKMNYIIEQLKTICEEDEYIILSDADIQFFRPEKVIDLINMAREQNLEYFGMAEATRNEYNGGFTILKNTQQIRDFYQTIYDRISVTKYRYGDQTVINELLPKSSIKNLKIPKEYVIWGNNIYDKKQSIFHHAVCILAVDGKLKQMEKIRQQFYR